MVMLALIRGFLVIMISVGMLSAPAWVSGPAAAEHLNEPPRQAIIPTPAYVRYGSGPIEIGQVSFEVDGRLLPTPIWSELQDTLDAAPDSKAGGKGDGSVTRVIVGLLDWASTSRNLTTMFPERAVLDIGEESAL